MAHTNRIFIATNAEAEVRRVVEELFDGEEFTRTSEHDPYWLVSPHEAVTVYLDTHDFGDEEILDSTGRPIPLRSHYPWQLDVRRPDRDPRAQRRAAQRIYDAIAAHSAWDIVHLENAQHVVAYRQ